MEDGPHDRQRSPAWRFTGSAWGLFGNWIKWWLLIIITIGIYSFWVYPRLTKWIRSRPEERFEPEGYALGDEAFEESDR